MDAVAPANIILVHGEANEMLRLKGELVSAAVTHLNVSKIVAISIAVSR
jgi:hypothetical protein